MSLALEYRRCATRYFAARTISATRPGARLAGALAGNVAPLRLIEQADPAPPDESWTRVEPALSGICGSDLGLLTGRSSPYLGPLTSMPFVMGHEVVGRTVDELPGLSRGSRVVIDPVLRCAARGLPACPACLAGHTGRCDGITTGRLAAGLQTGFCADTGGGWSRRMLAHASQLHPVPDSLPDEIAVLVEPLACVVPRGREPNSLGNGAIDYQRRDLLDPSRRGGGAPGFAGARPGFARGGPPGFGRPGLGGGAPGGGGLGGLLDAGTPSAALVSLLKENASSYRWVAAAVGANSAAGIQLATDEPVMAIGGFNGTDPSPTLAEFQAYVAAGKVHYFIGGSGGRGGGFGSSSSSNAITAWVTANFTAQTVGGVTVYDLS